MNESNGNAPTNEPSVTIVYLVYNRREQLRESLRRMLEESGYPRDRLDVVVVDNASTDGSADMVREEFPDTRLIVRSGNAGVSGWNEGLAIAQGDYVLALDDDCYLPPGGLRLAVEAAAAHEANLVSFKVVSTYEQDHVFTEKYRTGLFSFWGCAVLMRRRVVEALGGYDPEIFVWANELEFMLRFYDEGFRHLHLPAVIAQHMKKPPKDVTAIDWRPYRINARHFAYIAAKLLWRRDALEALVALVVRVARDAVREEPVVIKAEWDTLKGFVHGLRHRRPLRNREISRFYRRNFETFASPWWLARSPAALARALPKEMIAKATKGVSRPDGIGRREQFFQERTRYYPDAEPAALDFAGAVPPAA